MAAACLAFMDTFTKKIVLGAPFVMVIWVRYLIQASMTTLFILPVAGRTVLLTSRPWILVFRGVLLMLTTLLAMLSLKFLPVGEFAAIIMTTPLLVTLLSSRLLKEKPSGIRIGLVFGGFCGTLLIVRPTSGNMGWEMVFPVLLVISNTAFQILTSFISKSERSMTTHFYSVWVGALMSTFLLIFGWSELEGTQLWIELFAIGAAGALGHFLLILAFERAPAVTLMPYMYMQIGFAMIGGWLIFDHLPDHFSMLGIGLIAICGLAGGVLTIVETRQASPQ
jgi:drug/metabolite transporter (DMT)-like permease